MSEREKAEFNRMMKGGSIYYPYKTGDMTFQEIKPVQKRFNDSEYWKFGENPAFTELKKHFLEAPDDMTLIPPVYFDHGNRIRFGKRFFANTDFTVLDATYVTFGDNVFVGPHCSIYAVGHPIDAEIRNKNLNIAAQVTVGSDVWIGGNVVINPGVTIGSDVVIAAGSVVNHDIPDHCIAGGNPCRVIREITEDDRKYWHDCYAEYEAEMKAADEADING